MHSLVFQLLVLQPHSLLLLHFRQFPLLSVNQTQLKRYLLRLPSAYLIVLDEQNDTFPRILGRLLNKLRSSQHAPKYPVLSRLLFSRSEEHTSELQSRPHLVCRLLLEKKKIDKLIWEEG